MIYVAEFVDFVHVSLSQKWSCLVFRASPLEIRVRHWFLVVTSLLAKGAFFGGA